MVLDNLPAVEESDAKSHFVSVGSDGNVPVFLAFYLIRTDAK